MARLFTRRLAHVLAGFCWFALPSDSFGNHHLFCGALTGEPRPNAAEKLTEGGTVAAATPQRVGKAGSAAKYFLYVRRMSAKTAPSAIGSAIVLSRLRVMLQRARGETDLPWCLTQECCSRGPLLIY